MEKIIFITNREELQEQEREFAGNIMEGVNTTPLGDLGREIAEHRFREPIVIFDRLAVRPFWRDGKSAPDLPLSEPVSSYSSSHF